MPTHAQLKALRQSVQRPAASTAEFKREVAQSLAAAGVPATSDDSETSGPHTLIGVLRDADGRVRLWLVPDSAITPSERTSLETASGRCFASFFIEDLSPQQFAGALIVLVRSGELRVGSPGDGIYDAIAESFAAEGVEMPTLSWETVFGDGWGTTPLSEPAALGDVQLTHAYWFHIAV